MARWTAVPRVRLSLVRHAMNAEAPQVRELHLVVGFDGSRPAVQALDTAARLLSVRPPGRITVVWVAHVTSEVQFSADAVAMVETAFYPFAGDCRTAVGERLAASGLPWDFRWRQGLIA